MRIKLLIVVLFLAAGGFIQFKYDVIQHFIEKEDLLEKNLELTYQGDFHASYRVATIYLNRSTPGSVDERRAIYFYERAAGGGLIEAKIALLDVLERNPRAEISSNVDAITEELKNSEHSSALLYMGRSHEIGRNVLQDYRQAFYLYTKALQKGDLQAIPNLARMYKDGIGIDKDPVRAYMWYNLAQANGVKFNSWLTPIPMKNLSNEQVLKAQAMSKICLESGYRKCW